MFGVLVVNGWLAGLLSLGAIAAVVLIAHFTVAADVPSDTPDPVKKRRRGVKALIVGVDGRASTSRLQAVLWTFVVLFAYLFLLVWGRSSGCPDPHHERQCAPAVAADGALSKALSGDLQTEYYVLLGFPIAAAVAASALTKNKVASGDLKKKPIAGSPPKGVDGVKQGIAEVISNDEGNTDLVDFQYLAFNLLTLAYFSVQFLTTPSAGLPDIPPTLLALAGVSTATYTAKKAIESDVQPGINRVIPQRAPRASGTKLTLVGLGFGAKTGRAQVLIDNLPATTTDWTDGQIKAELDAELISALPDGAPLSVEVTVLDSDGRASDPYTIELYSAASPPPRSSPPTTPGGATANTSSAKAPARAGTAPKAANAPTAAKAVKKAGR